MNGSRVDDTQRGVGQYVAERRAGHHQLTGGTPAAPGVRQGEVCQPRELLDGRSGRTDQRKHRAGDRRRILLVQGLLDGSPDDRIQQHGRGGGRPGTEPFQQRMHGRRVDQAQSETAQLGGRQHPIGQQQSAGAVRRTAVGKRYGEGGERLRVVQ